MLRNLFTHIVFVAALTVGVGCTTMDKFDKESGKLLDKINSPGGSTSSSSYSSARATSSGLSVVEREAMPRRFVTDARGNDVAIWGHAKLASEASR